MNVLELSDKLYSLNVSSLMPMYIGEDRYDGSAHNFKWSIYGESFVLAIVPDSSSTTVGELLKILDSFIRIGGMREYTVLINTGYGLTANFKVLEAYKPKNCESCLFPMSHCFEDNDDPDYHGDHNMCYTCDTEKPGINCVILEA